MPTDADFLRQYLAGRDVPCPMCEYNLRDLLGDRCPECGDQLTLAVNPVEPKQAAAITGLILLAAGAGLNGLLLLYWLFTFWRDSRAGDKFIWEFFDVNAGGFAVEGVALAIWIIQWKKIRRLGPVSRWVLAVCFCGFLTIADLVVFTKYIR